MVRSAAPADGKATSVGSANGTTMTPRSSDFDFLIGTWAVRHRRLKARLAGCSDWAEFSGTCAVRTILDGLGNADDNFIELPEGAYCAVTLRTFDPASSLWTIWWLDGRTPGRLDPPMVGRFANGVGTFYGDDVFDGRPILIRFLWTRPQTDSPRWEQAFSADRGATWETNWSMDFSPAR